MVKAAGSLVTDLDGNRPGLRQDGPTLHRTSPFASPRVAGLAQLQVGNRSASFLKTRGCEFWATEAQLKSAVARAKACLRHDWATEAQLERKRLRMQKACLRHDWATEAPQKPHPLAPFWPPPGLRIRGHAWDMLSRDVAGRLHDAAIRSAGRLLKSSDQDDTDEASAVSAGHSRLPLLRDHATDAAGLASLRPRQRLPSAERRSGTQILHRQVRPAAQRLEPATLFSAWIWCRAAACHCRPAGPQAVIDLTTARVARALRISAPPTTSRTVEVMAMLHHLGRLWRTLSHPASRHGA